MIERAPITTSVYLYPNPVPAPLAPTLERYDSRYGLDEPGNFRRFQRNTLLMTDYIISLQEVVGYYEKECQRLKQLDKKDTAAK